MTTNPPTLPTPVSIAGCGLTLAARRGIPVLDGLAEHARTVGVRPFHDASFDAAAAMVGQFYCRALDLYVDRETFERAERLHYTEAHMALI